MENDLEDRSRRHAHIRRHLDSKHTKRLFAFGKGAFLQHNYLVRCGKDLSILNPENDQSERFWRIFPVGGSYSRVGDACAIATWWCLIIFPAVAVLIGIFNSRNVKICCVVVVSLFLIWFLVLIYLIVKNEKKFYRLWCVSKVNREEFSGLKSQVKEVTLETVRDMEYLLSASKFKGVVTTLAKMNHGTVSVMLCMKNFRTCHVIDPIISLLLLSIPELVVLIVLLDMST